MLQVDGGVKRTLPGAMTTYVGLVQHIFEVYLSIIRIDPAEPGAYDGLNDGQRNTGQRRKAAQPPFLWLVDSRRFLGPGHVRQRGDIQWVPQVF